MQLETSSGIPVPNENEALVYPIELKREHEEARERGPTTSGFPD